MGSCLLLWGLPFVRPFGCLTRGCCCLWVLRWACSRYIVVSFLWSQGGSQCHDTQPSVSSVIRTLLHSAHITPASPVHVNLLCRCHARCTGSLFKAAGSYVGVAMYVSLYAFQGLLLGRIPCGIFGWLGSSTFELVCYPCCALHAGWCDVAVYLACLRHR